MTKLSLIFFIFHFFILSVSGKAVRLKEINDPGFDIHVHGSRLYIPEESRTYIYSLKDLKLLGSFGKQGEGPGEFRGEVYINYQKGKLLVESAGKISFFTLDGLFMSEHIFPEKTFVKRMTPVAEKFVGYGGTVVDSGTNYITLFFYDKDMQKQGEITRTKSNFQKDGTITFMNGTFNFKIFKDLIYVQYLGQDMKLDVFDRDGVLKFTVRDPEFRNKKVSEKDKKDAIDYFRKFMPELYTRRQRIRFSDKWGGVGTFFFDESDNSLYIITYAQDKTGKYLFYKYGTDGKFIKKFYLDVGYRDIWAPYPLDIENGKLYQLIENYEDEEWDLIIKNLN